MAGAQPTASGTLQKTPLLHLLVHLLDHRLSGTLVVEQPGGQKSAVYFQHGIPAKAKTSETVIHLGRLLLEMGLLDEQGLNRSLAKMSAEQRLHGEILMADGLVDAKGLFEALREQVLRKIVWMFKLPGESVYGYYDGQNFLQKWGGAENTPIEPFVAVWHGVCHHTAPAVAEAATKKLGDSVLRLHRDATISRFRLGNTEQAVLDIMRVKPQSFAKLAQTGLASAEELNRLIYALVITRNLDLGDGKPPVGVVRATQTPPRASKKKTDDEPVSSRPSSSRRRPPARNPVLDPAVAAFRAEIKERAGSVDQMNYYDILGVERTADAGAVQSAFFELAKKWHPDRLGPDLADVRAEATKVFARMSEASQILTSDERRKEYDEVLKTGTGSADEQEEVQRVLSAVTEFQKAEVLLKKGDLVGALRHAKAAYEADKEQPEYMAIYAWIQAQAPERMQQKKYLDLLSLLDRAVDKASSNEKIRMWRGHLRKRAGQTAEAAQDFKWVARHNKSNLDAVRELRLLRMRGEASDSAPPNARKSVPPGAKGRVPPAGKVGGFLKGLFKKD